MTRGPVAAGAVSTPAAPNVASRRAGKSMASSPCHAQTGTIHPATPAGVDVAACGILVLINVLMGKINADQGAIYDLQNVNDQRMNHSGPESRSLRWWQRFRVVGERMCVGDSHELRDLQVVLLRDATRVAHPSRHHQAPPASGWQNFH